MSWRANLWCPVDQHYVLPACEGVSVGSRSVCFTSVSYPMAWCGLRLLCGVEGEILVRMVVNMKEDSRHCPVIEYLTIRAIRI